MKIFKQKYLAVDIILLSAILISALSTDFHSVNSSLISKNYSSNLKNESGDGNKIIVKGRNLYPNMLEHIQGEISKQVSI